MTDMCDIAGCANPRNPSSRWCIRHIENRAAPPALLTCECAVPDVERLPQYGPTTAYCRWCGSPLEGSLCQRS